MAIQDPFASHTNSISGPVTGGFDIVPDDGVDLAILPRAIMVAVAGDVAMRFQDGSEVTLPGLVPGVIYPVRPARIQATGTSADGIKGLT